MAAAPMRPHRSGAAAGPIPLAIWLLPAEPDASRWQAVIDALSALARGPRFEAHVTVHVGWYDAAFDPVPAMQREAANAAPLTLQAAATESSDVFFRTVFIPLDGPAVGRAALVALRHRLVQAWHRGAETPDDRAEMARALDAYRLDPHLSLLYARLEPSARTALAASHQHPGTPIRFDRLAFVKPAPGHDDLATVDRWRVFGHCRLGPPPAGG